MSKLKTIALISILVILLFGTTCFAKNIKLKQLTKQNTVSVNELLNYKSAINNEITSDGINYKLVDIQQTENKKKLEKNKEIQEELIVTTNNEYSVLSMFETNKKITEDGYTGTLELRIDTLDIRVNESYQEEYKVYMQKTYKNVNSNELNDIPKKVKKDGTTYYLIDPVWSVSATEKIGDNEVPLTYMGVMYYEGVKVRTVVKNYKATVNYVGTLEKEIIDSVTYTITYEEVPNETNYLVPTVVTSCIIFFSGIVIVKRKNVKIYNYSNYGYRLIKRIHINKKESTIDITPLKVTSNKYKIVLSSGLFNNLKDSNIKIKYFDKQFIYNIKEQKFEITV